MADSYNVQASKFFIFGILGEELKKLSPEKYKALLHDNPEKALFWDSMEKLTGLQEELREASEEPEGEGPTVKRAEALQEREKKIQELKEALQKELKLTHHFRESAKTLQRLDYLSLGSSLVGQVGQPQGSMGDFVRKPGQEGENDN